MVPPREFHKGRGRFWGEQRLGRGKGVARRAGIAVTRGRSLTSPVGSLGGETKRRPMAVLVNLLLAALSGAAN
jgi:hypothetical protein